jgi:hypothetical protein
MGATSCTGGSVSHPRQSAHVQKIAVVELIAPDHTPMVLGLYVVEAAPAAIIDSIMVDHVSDSKVANTRPRYLSSTWWSNCEKFSTELTATAPRDSAMNTHAHAIVGIWLNRIYANPWIT